MIVPGETCADAPDLTAGGTVMGDTTSAADNFDPAAKGGCPVGTVSGNDQVFKFSPGVITTYQAVITPSGGSNYDPSLYVLHDCGNPDSCSEGTVFNGPGESETLDFTVNAGETAFLIVDGEISSGASEGIYTLTVTIQ